MRIRNFNLENKDLFLKLEEFNSTIKLEGNNLFIDNFQGKLNEGNIKLTGEFNIPTLKEVSENPYYKEELKYKFNLKLDKIKYKYGNRHFWCRGYYVDTVGRYEGAIKEYIRNQLEEDIAQDTLNFKEYTDPFTGEPVK